MVYRKNNDELKLLKFFVYTMGLVLMVGTVTLTYIIYKRNASVLKEFSQVVSSNEKKCENLVSNFVFDAEVIQVTESGNKLILLTKPQSGNQQVIIFDYCKNKIINNLYIDIKSRKAQSYEPEAAVQSDSVAG